MITRRNFLKWTGLGLLGAATVGFWAGRSTANPYYNGPKSDHFNGRVFFNPGGAAPKQFSDILRWQFGGGREKWPTNLPSPFRSAKPEARLEADKIAVTHVGHASFLIQFGRLNLLTDPVWSERASPFSFVGPKRVNLPGIEFDDLPKIDAVLLTHNHYDHMDKVTLARLSKAHDPQFITPLGNDAMIKKALPENARILTGDWGEFVNLNDNTRLYFEPCHHWSARGMRDRSMALWSAFVLEKPDFKLYHIGDTGFHRGINFTAAKQKHGVFDLALLPIGAYEPRWFMKDQHMNPAEAVEGFKLCGAKQALGHHWGTFQLTNEAHDAPQKALDIALKENGIANEQFIAMRPGQIWQNDQSRST